MRRFFLAAPLSQTMQISGADARHIGKVLRMNIGDLLTVVDENGQTGVFQIQSFHADTVEIILNSVLNEDHEPPVDVYLAQSLPKGDKMEYIIQKAVELGAVKIIPMLAEHCVVKYDHKKKAERCSRWQKIAAEAAKQCKRTAIPVVEEIQDFSHIITNQEEGTLVMMLYEGQACQSFKSLLVSHKHIKRFLLLIGPEGGFSPKEVARCQEHGIVTVSLGSRILRTETASLAALAAIMYENGDLGG